MCKINVFINVTDEAARKVWSSRIGRGIVVATLKHLPQQVGGTITIHMKMLRISGISHV